MKETSYVQIFVVFLDFSPYYHLFLEDANQSSVVGSEYVIHQGNRTKAERRQINIP